MIDSLEYNNLQNHAKNIRRNIVEMVHSASSGHPGGSLSIADILSSISRKRLFPRRGFKNF